MSPLPPIVPPSTRTADMLGCGLLILLFVGLIAGLLFVFYHFIVKYW